MKIRSLSIISLCFVIAACSTMRGHQTHASAGRRMAMTPSATTPDAFAVRYEGIIVFANLNGSYDSRLPSRAILIEGNAFTMAHQPQLVFDADMFDHASLRDAAGKPVECDRGSAILACSVAIDDLQFMIRGDGDPGNKPLGPLRLDTKTFGPDCTIVPHLRDYVDLTPDPAHNRPPGFFRPMFLSDDPPTTDAAGYFEIDGGGELHGMAFKPDASGQFYRGQNPLSSCMQFASFVDWNGKTSGSATLMVRSRDTLWRWTPIKRGPGSSSGPLTFHIENETSHFHDHPTPSHFALFGKLFANADMPTIVNCTVTSECAPSVTGSEIAVAGCSDTNWP